MVKGSRALGLGFGLRLQLSLTLNPKHPCSPHLGLLKSTRNPSLGPDVFKHGLGFRVWYNSEGVYLRLL